MTDRHAPVRSWWWSEQLLCLNSRNGDVDSYVEHLVTEPADNFHDHHYGHCDACLPIVQRFCWRESRSSIIALNSTMQCNDATVLPLHWIVHCTALDPEVCGLPPGSQGAPSCGAPLILLPLPSLIIPLTSIFALLREAFNTKKSQQNITATMYSWTKRDHSKPKLLNFPKTLIIRKMMIMMMMRRMRRRRRMVTIVMTMLLTKTNLYVPFTYYARCQIWSFHSVTKRTKLTWKTRPS